MLGRLARWLRILGYDTLYNPRWPDDELARRARAQGRILLTRDHTLARRRGLHALLVQSELVERQLEQVSAALGLDGASSFSRCPVCNDLLVAVRRSEAWGYVPPYTFVTHDEFRLCPTCNRFYWRGTHYEHMQRIASGNWPLTTDHQ